MFNKYLSFRCKSGYDNIKTETEEKVAKLFTELLFFCFASFFFSYSHKHNPFIKILNMYHALCMHFYT